MNGLADFLLQRIAEDEAVARAAAEPGRSRWRWQTLFSKPEHALIADGDEGTGLRPTDIMRVAERHLDAAPADHIARHDPARVLAECEAKRRIMAAISKWLDTHPDEDHVPAGDDALAWLALPYADHPDYQGGVATMTSRRVAALDGTEQDGESR